VSDLRPAAATAALITSCRLAGGLLDDLGGDARPVTELDAYRVQAIAHPLLEAAGFGRQASWKIGCTMPACSGPRRNPCRRDLCARSPARWPSTGVPSATASAPTSWAIR
jgi:hypothetical protein